MAALSLLSIGVLFIYSAGIGDEPSSALGRQWVKQLLFIGIGIPLYLGVALFDYRHLRDMAACCTEVACSSWQGYS
jgi:cell division protein FtsW (lipid II flippase)